MYVLLVQWNSIRIMATLKVIIVSSEWCVYNYNAKPKKINTHYHSIVAIPIHIVEIEK